MDSVEQVSVAPGATALTFDEFFRQAEPPLRAALVSTLGADRGRDAAAEALRYAWEHWERVQSLDNPTGYLFRLGQRWGRRQALRLRRPFAGGSTNSPATEFEPGLGPALAALPTRQRQVVVLCLGYRLSHAEAAALLGIERSSVQNHAERGLRRLQHLMGVEP